MSGWILQAAALDRGSLVVVQSLSSLGLVIAVPLGGPLHQPGGQPPGHHRSRRHAARNRAVPLVGISRRWDHTPDHSRLGVRRHRERTRGTRHRLADLRPRRHGRGRIRTAAVRPQDRHSGACHGVQQCSHAVRQRRVRVTIFGEKLSSRHGQLIPALLGLGAALVGVVLLAGTKPPQASTPVPFSDTSPPAEIRPELHPQASSYRSSPSVALHAAGGSEAASSSTAGSAAHRPGPPAERSSPRRVRVDPPPAQGHARRGR